MTMIMPTSMSSPATPLARPVVPVVGGRPLSLSRVPPRGHREIFARFVDRLAARLASIGRRR